MNNVFLACQKTHTQNPDIDSFHMHTHDFYEIYCFISGNAKYLIEGNIYNLKYGDILFIKKAEAHTLRLTSSAPYERTVISFNAAAAIDNETQRILSSFDDINLGQGNRFPFSKFKDKNWLYYIDKIISCENEDTKRLYLSVLINEMYECLPEALSLRASRDNLADIIPYLNNNLTMPLTLDSICKKFYISKSQLNRSFKRMTASTVWEYIIEKRCILAKELLQNGETPMNVYSRCGFNDYASFFRAYKAKFSVSPKHDFVKPSKTN